MKRTPDRSRKRGPAGPSKPARPPWWRAGAVGRALVLAHLVLSPLAFWRGTPDVFEHTKVALLLLAACALAALGLCSLVGLAAGAPAGRRLRGLGSAIAGIGRSPVALAFLLYTVSAAVSTAVSLSPRTSLLGAHESCAGLLTVAGGLVLFLATRALFRTPNEIRQLLGGAVIAAAVVSAYACLQSAQADPLPWTDLAEVIGRARPFSTLGHPNFLAAYLVMVLPVTLHLAERSARARSWGACGILAGVALLSACAVVASLSRGAWLAGACAAVVVLLGRRSGRWPGLGWVAVLALLAGALLGGAILTGSLDGVGHRLARLADLNGRGQIWQVAWQTFRDHPLCGCGLDTFQVAFGMRRTPGCVDLGWDLTPSRAHNEPLHVLATQGLLGGAALLGVVVSLLAAGWRACQPSLPDRPLRTAILAGVMAFLVQDLFSFTVAGCGTLFVTLAALLSRLAEEPAAEPGETGVGVEGIGLCCGSALGLLVLLLNILAEPTSAGGILAWAALALAGAAASFAVLRVAFSQPQPSPVVPAPVARTPLPARVLQGAVWAAAAAVAALVVVQPYQAALACGRGTALQGEDAGAALACYEKAVALAPQQDIYWLKLAGGAQALARAARTPQERASWLRRALLAQEQTVALVPASPSHHANLGRILFQLACEGLEPAERVEAAFEAALARDPANASFLADGAWMMAELRRWDEAERYRARGLALYPRCAQFWALGGYMALARQRPDEAERDLAEAVGADWHGDQDSYDQALELLSIARLQQGQLEGARSLAADLARHHPERPRPHLVLAQALQRLGRPDEARAEYGRVLALNPDDQAARQELRRLDEGR